VRKTQWMRMSLSGRCTCLRDAWRWFHAGTQARHRHCCRRLYRRPCPPDLARMSRPPDPPRTSSSCPCPCPCRRCSYRLPASPHHPRLGEIATQLQPLHPLSSSSSAWMVCLQLPPAFWNASWTGQSPALVTCYVKLISRDWIPLWTSAIPSVETRRSRGRMRSRAPSLKGGWWKWMDQPSGRQVGSQGTWRSWVHAPGAA
jgi:hypothetical protein